MAVIHIIPKPLLKNKIKQNGIFVTQYNLKAHTYCYKGIKALWCVTFTPSNNIAVPFKFTSEVKYQVLLVKRVDRSLCTFLFSAEHSCGRVFENSVDYENHLLQRCQLSFSNISTMDKIKYAFPAQMVSLLELHFINVAKGPTSADIQINDACCLYRLMNLFQEKGWAISKRVSFQYFYTFFSSLFQASLQQAFMKGLKTAKPGGTL